MSYFERFTKWQNYAHYVLLSIGLALYYFYTQTLIDISIWTQFKLFSQVVLEQALVLLVVDSLVHGLFWILPKPFRWRD